ncbi:MAG: elongation factor P [Chloroflexia bacterium]
MTITTSELKKGQTILLDGEMYKITEWSHNKQGRGSANVRLQLRNVRNGANIERTFMAGSKFEDVRLERRPVQFQYSDGDDFNFMDSETYEQLSINRSILGDAPNYMREGDTVDILMFRGEPIDIDLPTSVVLTVEQTETGLQGDRSTAGTKPARLETGLVVHVPLFVSTGDRVKVDTRDGKYLERA